MPDLPIRSEQHEIGDAAVREFEHSIPGRWATNRADSDYGWDRIVLIAHAGSREVHEEFYVQVKGSRSVEYVVASSFASIPLERSTINFLLNRQMPVMIALCDVAHAEKPIYWVWLPTALKAVESRKVNWRNQETVTLRIPTSQVLSRDIDQIEKDVRRQISESRLAEKMLDFFLPQDKRSSISLPEPTSIDETYVKTTILPSISIPSTALDSVGSIGPDSCRDRLQQVSALLRENSDSRAEEILNGLGKDILHSSVQVQAAYHNSKGILALHRLRLKEAHDDFSKALELNPSEPKHITNVLISEYAIGGHDALPDDWRDRLQKVVAQHPNFVPAVRIHSLILAHDNGLEAAEDFVRSSPAFCSEPRPLLVALAEAAEQRGEIERALNFIAQAEKLGTTDAELLSIKSIVLLRKALFITRELDSGFHVDGYGPSELDIDVLSDSADTFESACTALNAIGLPRWGEATIANAAIAFMIGQRFSDARRHCEAFLKRHPNSIAVSTALAMILFYSGEASEAVAHASHVYQETQDSGSFKNLLLILIKAEEYEKMLEMVRARQDSGFADPDEQCLALNLAAVAFAELGQDDNAHKCVRQIRETLNRPADAVAADIFLAKRSATPPSQMTKMIRDALEAYPGHPVLEAEYFQAMLPVSTENAADLIQHVSMLAKKRQLAIHEAAALGEAYFILRRYAEAEVVFRTAAKRFPMEPEFLMHQAYALHELGRDEDAFLVLNTFLSKGRHSFAVYRNLGHLARITGRLDDAIKLFELAVGRTKDPSDRAELHCLLYELHKRRGDTVKEQLRHAVQYGSICVSDPESEARYLMMFMVASLPLNSIDDDLELKAWVSEFQERLKQFSNAHPRFHSLMTLRAPEGLSGKDAAYWLFTEMASLMLPINLVRSSIEIRMREGAWPLPTRAELLGENSLCDYWNKCRQSTDPEHAIYIFSSPLDFMAEVRDVSLRGAICVDITALLTLQHLDLLDDVLRIFDYWIISAGTREALENDSTRLIEPHPPASTLSQWIIDHRSKIRMRKLAGADRQERRTEKYHMKAGIWVRDELMISDLVGKGVGETLLLAHQLGIPLYSDETTIRQWGAEQYGVRSFSTVALLRRLGEESRLSLVDETCCIVKLINSNFKYVPFCHEHLLQAFEQLVLKQPVPMASDLAAHSLLGPLLKQFSDLKLDNSSIFRIAIAWWLDLIRKKSLSAKTKAEVMASLAFRLSQRTLEGVLTGIDSKKPLMRMSQLCALMLAATYESDKSLVTDCWSAIKSAAESLTHDEKVCSQMLYQYVPRFFYSCVRVQSKERLVNALVEVPGTFPESDKRIWQELLLRLAKKDHLVQ